MTSSAASTSTLTPCGSPTPEQIPVQPDHFYSLLNAQSLPSPSSDGKTWLDPADDPMAQRGIPVFKPTMAEFQDFEGYMNQVECWGTRSGIVKVIPPREWTDSLPPIKDQLADVKIKSPIEQVIFGDRGLFRQQNMEKRKWMSVREWVELCNKEDYRAPGIREVNLAQRTAPVMTRPRAQRRGKRKTGSVSVEAPGLVTDLQVKDEPTDDISMLEKNSPQPQCIPNQMQEEPLATSATKGVTKDVNVEDQPKSRPKRVYPSRQAREANIADRAARDRTFIDIFEPNSAWLPHHTKPEDYTPEFCQQLERRFWRGLGLGGKPAWYGADTQGSLFTDATQAWNVAHLPSALSRLLPSSSNGLPGVNTPYLYFGMWRATFAWHVEDMDLFSINYIHFGAPKFWYAIPQGRAAGLEQAMRSHFPKDTSQCSQFLRHKSFLASPSVLAKDSCKPNCLVQQAGEFVITFPRGYHAGFNLGLNCAESVNFALDSWIEIGRKAKACECVNDSVRIDIDQLLREREVEREDSVQDLESPALSKPTSSDKDIKEERHDSLKPASRKRKLESGAAVAKAKKIKVKGDFPAETPHIESNSKLQPKLSITLKLGPRTDQEEDFPCCLCVSTNPEGLLRVINPPFTRKDVVEATGQPKAWMAHEFCARVVPETWVDISVRPDGSPENVVYGADGIVKDRWNLKCSACTRSKLKAHGAPIQCTKGKCARAFHVSCARDGLTMGVVFGVIREVDKEVILLDDTPPIDQRVVAEGQSHLTQNAALQYSSSSGCVVKVVKKFEIQTLCPQHNPAIAAQKKANKQDKIRNELISLPSMSRIKIRVSSGVFEVSLIRVIEETGSVEVLWDQNTKKEFKWGSIVFGNTDTPIEQKPGGCPPAPPPISGSALSDIVSPMANALPANPASSTTPATVSTNLKPQLYLNGTQMTYPPFAGAVTYGQWATGTNPYGVPASSPFTCGAATTTVVPQRQSYGQLSFAQIYGQSQVPPRADLAEMQSLSTTAETDAATLQNSTPLNNTMSDARQASSDFIQGTTESSIASTSGAQDVSTFPTTAQLADILRANPQLAMVLAAMQAQSRP